jgi:DNA-cytosine methyltransferase
MSASLPPELRDVRRRIQAERLDPKEAARQIGVGPDTLTRHLNGEYLRSDSLAKYRRWLTSRSTSRTEQLKLVASVAQESSKQEPASFFSCGSRSFGEVNVPDRPHLVVDLFSGAGGMSAGFDLFERGAYFETVFAVDVEEAMVRAFNSNHAKTSGSHSVCRQLDLSDLLNEAEVLALYLDHFASLRNDDHLRRQLEQLPVIGLSTFKSLIEQTDSEFIRELGIVKQSEQCRSSLKLVSPGALLQTSVIGFHNALGLPISSSSAPTIGPLVWAQDVSSDRAGRASSGLRGSFRKVADSLHAKMQRQWDTQVEQLAARAQGAGRGQLASSAARIKSFLDFLQTPAMKGVRSLWVRWRSERQALRILAFGAQTDRAIRTLYDEDDRRVAVLLGGPPCQGFSRIGRGKLRSLSDQQVHVQADAEAGDSRNRLLHKYVLFVSALAPSVFLFENVRHFQSEVQTPEGMFLATDVLADAIRSVSSSELQYQVASRIIDAAKYVIPQARERFFMVGVRSHPASLASVTKEAAEWCLALPERDPVDVSVALDGLPNPISIKSSRANGKGLEETVEIAEVSGYANDSSTELVRWLRQEPPRKLREVSARHVDSHHVRAPREDDAALFALFGPGKRWMDYRCDGVETLTRLRSALETLERVARAHQRAPKAAGSAIQEALTDMSLKEIQELRAITDGSLSLRLLLETITPLPGELTHHLRTPAYLSKREGNHGDWLARLAGDRPSKTIMSHMAKDTYGYVHPTKPRTLSVREAARVQTFPDWYSFRDLSLGEAFRVIGNAVPPLLSHQLAERVAWVVSFVAESQTAGSKRGDAIRIG